jgi:peptide-methionine (S)-S-oxide reductase
MAFPTPREAIAFSILHWEGEWQNDPADSGNYAHAFDGTTRLVGTMRGVTPDAYAANRRTERPSYTQVGAGGTGHLEAVRIVFDPAKVSYERLLEVFWHNVDPLDAGGQFCDRGETYRTAVFVHGAGQRRSAEASKAALEAEDRRRGAIATEIRDAGPFWPAEDYHQDYYRKNPARYRFYRWNCGRDARLREVWGPGAAGGH